MLNNYQTSCAVTEGNSYKLANIISDAILDRLILLDKDIRADIHTTITRDSVIVRGEVCGIKSLAASKLIRSVIKEIGYEHKLDGIDPYRCVIDLKLDRQSQDICKGITDSTDKEGGAGDVAVIYGYATNETIEYLPFATVMARKLVERLVSVRKMGVIDVLRPDGKVMVTAQYDNEKPKHIKNIVLQAQHSENADTEWLRVELLDRVVKYVAKEWITQDTNILINTAGKFILGGPRSDVGTSGATSFEENYGGSIRSGGGAFAGKDASKIDRTGAILARMIAKAVVANGLAQKCEVALSYVIGVADPVCFEIETFGTGFADDDYILRFIKERFSFKPNDIVKKLNLKRPIYKDLSQNGHFGRENLPWEVV